MTHIFHFVDTRGLLFKADFKSRSALDLAERECVGIKTSENPLDPRSQL